MTEIDTKAIDSGKLRATTLDLKEHSEIDLIGRVLESNMEHEASLLSF